MTVYKSSDVAFFLADGFSLLPYMLTIDAKATATVMDTTPLGATAERKQFGGVRSATIEQTVVYDDSAQATNAFIRDASFGNLASSCPVAWALAGNALGQPFFGYPSMLVSAERRGVNKGEVVVQDISYESAGSYGREEGVILAPAGTVVTSASNQAGADCGGAPVSVSSSSVANPTVITTSSAHGLASGDTVIIASHTGSTPSINGTYVVTVTDATHFTIPVNVTVGGTGGTVQRANGGSLHVHVPAITLGGYTNWVVKLQSATTIGGTYTDVSGASATFTTAPTAAAIAIPAGTPISQYCRVAYVLTGSGSSPSLSFFAGFARR